MKQTCLFGENQLEFIQSFGLFAKRVDAEIPGRFISFATNMQPNGKGEWKGDR